jgi:hypothetical protein
MKLFLCVNAENVLVYTLVPCQSITVASNVLHEIVPCSRTLVSYTYLLDLVHYTYSNLETNRILSELMATLRIQVLWHVTLSRWVSGS